MMFNRCRHALFFGRAICIQWAVILTFLSGVTAVHGQFNDWVSPVSGNWDAAGNWSTGLPNSSQAEVRIFNANSKAIGVQPGTPVNFPQSMTVQNLRLGGVALDSNLLLLNYFGTTVPLRVLYNFNIEPNGRVLMLYSGLNVNQLHLSGLLDQEGGELVFTNSATNMMQIEGGRFSLTNGYVFGRSMFLGGTNDGYVTANGLVQLDALYLGSKPAFPNQSNGTYVLESGWLIANAQEVIGLTGFGTLLQNGGTNSSADIAVGKGTYVKAGGALFAGELAVLAPSESLFAPPSAIVTHGGGTATITNLLRLAGQGNRRNPHLATFNMLGGSLTTPRIQLEVAATFAQSNGVVSVANELFIYDHGGNVPSYYQLFGGNLYTAKISVSSAYPETSSFSQNGGTGIVTNQLWLNGTGMYVLTGGTVTVPNILLTGSLYNPPQFFIVGAPPFAITNQTVDSQGGAIVIENSAQAFGRLTVRGDSGINLAGNSAILRFADSHTNSWQSELFGVVPHLLVYNWNGSTNGGGTDQLLFGSNSSGLTASQVAQIQFINPAGFASGTYPARMLSNGEVVPMSRPTLNAQKNGMNLVLNWSGNFILQSATNVAGPYLDITNAISPYSVNVSQFPVQFFRLRN